VLLDVVVPLVVFHEVVTLVVHDVVVALLVLTFQYVVFAVFLEVTLLYDVYLEVDLVFVVDTYVFLEPAVNHVVLK